jgi:hypothetical protein
MAASTVPVAAIARAGESEGGGEMDESLVVGAGGAMGDKGKRTVAVVEVIVRGEVSAPPEK